jgi:hypothetical protein
MELDKDYLQYLQAMGEETQDPKYIWTYLAVLTEALESCVESPEKEGVKKLIGQFRIQPQAGKGYPKGPPQSPIITQ